MKSPVIKHSIVIASHKTSVSLEDEFWQAPKEAATARGTTLSTLVTSIDLDRQQSNLSSCLRLLVLDFYRSNQLAEETGVRNSSAAATLMRPARSA